MRLLWRAAPVLAPLGVFLSACGGEEEAAIDQPSTTIDQPSTIEEYAQSIKDLQEHSRAEFNAPSQDISLPGFYLDGSESPDSLVEHQDLAIQQGDRFFEAVRSLSPPAQILAAHSGFVEAWLPYRKHLEQKRDVWATAETIWDIPIADETTFEKDAIARNPFEDACIALEAAVGKEGFAANFGCEDDWFFGGEAVAAECTPSASEPKSDCPIVPRDCRGRTRLAEMPPLPSGLVAVTDFNEVVRQPIGCEQTVGLPLRKPVSDPATLGLYTYSEETWKRISDVTVRDVGTIVAEFTFQTVYPENYAVLQATR